MIQLMNDSILQSTLIVYSSMLAYYLNRVCTKNNISYKIEQILYNNGTNPLLYGFSFNFVRDVVRTQFFWVLWSSQCELQYAMIRFPIAITELRLNAYHFQPKSVNCN